MSDRTGTVHAMTTQQETVLFHEWLGEHDDGHLTDEMTAAMIEVVQAVTELGANGSVTLKVDVSRTGQSGRTLMLRGSVTSKVPKPQANGAIYFPDQRGRLHRDDPTQQRINFDEPDNVRSLPDGPARSLNDDSGAPGDNDDE